MDRERRNGTGENRARLRAELNEEQLQTLSELERFVWELKFVRHPLFLDILPVVFDADRDSYAVLRPDGTLDENPGFETCG